MPVKWEYLVEGLPIQSGQTIGIVRSNSNAFVDPLQAHLSARGEEGWELIQFVPNDIVASLTAYSTGTVFVFKRLKL